jgi:beta-glucosidase
MLHPANRRSMPMERAPKGSFTEMTFNEKLQLLKSKMLTFMRKRPRDMLVAAGYVPGIERLSIPALRLTEASLGVANMLNMRKDDVATALPSGLAAA